MNEIQILLSKINTDQTKLKQINQRLNFGGIL